jgi:hypothetical protein
MTARGNERLGRHAEMQTKQRPSQTPSLWAPSVWGDGFNTVHIMTVAEEQGWR